MPFDVAPTSVDGEAYRPAWQGSPTHVSCGLTYYDACGKHINSTLQAKRPYIIASGSLSRDTDAVDKLKHALGSGVVGIRRGMKSHTLWSEVLEVAAEAKNLESDVLVTLGAGSLTDAAKIVALAIANKATTFSDLESLTANSANPRADISAPTVRIICIPTTLSGGEYSHRAGGTHDQTHQKYSFSHPAKAPALVILDPELTTTTPERWWLSTGVRAIDHCVEAMCSLSCTAACEVDAANGLRLLVPGLIACKNDPKNLDARLKCQLGVIEAMKAANLHGVSMGASHGIGHQLGPLGVGHGETSCVLLPAVCEYNESVNGERQGKVAEVLVDAVGIVDGLKDDKRWKNVVGKGGKPSLADLLDAIFRYLGMPRSLSVFGVGGEEVLDRLAANSLKDRHCATNPRPLTEKQQVLNILEMVR